jgi:hypothetical protein
MMSRSPVLVIAIAAVLFAGQAAAQSSSATADSSLTVQRSLSVVAVRAIQITSPGKAATLSLSAFVDPDAPAEVRVTGDPGRVYRIRVPGSLIASDGVAIVEDLKIWSLNAGDVSTTRVSHMDMEGRDLLRITGQLRLEGRDPALEGAALPLSIDYE